MDKDQTKKNTKSHPLNTSQFFRGISFSGNFIFLIYVIPWIFVQFFKIGLEGAALWTLMIVGILLLLLPFLLRLPSKTRFSFNMILQWFLGLSLPVLGLIIEFIIDENSIKTIIFLGSILLGGYYSIFSEIYTQMNEKVNIFPEIPLQKNKFSFLLGMATIIALIFGISVAIPNYIPLYSILGAIFILKQKPRLFSRAHLI